MIVHPAYAVDIGAETNLGGIPIAGLFPREGGLGIFISSLLKNVFVFAGIVFLVMLIYGGINIIIGAGKGGKGEMETAWKAITYAVVGIVVMAASYFMVQVIEVVTGLKIL